MKTTMIVTVMLALVGCAGPGASRQAVEPTGASVACDCPMMVAGATASVADVDGGVAITWSAPPSEVASLRERVHAMAQQKGSMMAACPCRTMGRGAGPMQGMTSMQAMPPADLRAEDVEGGVRLTFTARNPADVPALRSHVHMHIEHMQSGGCPMM